MKKVLLKVIKFIVDWLMDRNMQPVKTITVNMMPSREYEMFKIIEIPHHDYSHLVRHKKEPQHQTIHVEEIRQWKENNRLVASYFNRRYAVAN